MIPNDDGIENEPPPAGMNDPAEEVEDTDSQAGRNDESDDEVVLQPMTQRRIGTRSQGLGRNEPTTQTDAPPDSSRQIRELRRLGQNLDTMTDAEVHMTLQDLTGARVQNAIEYVFSAALASEPGNPSGYKEAVSSDEVEFWINGMVTELVNCAKRKVYRMVDRSSVPRGKKILKTRWVYRKKEKEDGTVVHRSRVVVKGYDQIPGVDFTESFAPTANDTTMRILLVMTLLYRWRCCCIDIETAFLEAVLKEETWIEVPDGYEFAFGKVDRKNQVMLLLKAMYGLVQAPRAFYETFRTILTSQEVGMVQSKVDPCMFYRMKDNLLEAIMVIHVDDCAISGMPETVENIKRAIGKQLSVKDEGILSRHLGVSYTWNEDGSLKIHQNDYVDEIIKKFEKDFGKCRSFATPGYPGHSYLKFEGEPVMLTEYRSYVGKLLFAMKKTYPELANSIRELATHMDNPGPDQWKGVERICGYLKYEATHGITFQVPTGLAIVGFVDSDFATNKETRKSTTGYLVTVGGCLVSWSSKAQPSVTLSSTEAEYVAASLCATEIKFVSMLLDELKADYPKPAVMREDNTGAIFLMKNDQVGQRTKHIDIRWHHVRDMIKDGLLVVVYIKTDENPADIMTKNAKEAIFLRHSLKLKKGVLVVGSSSREDVVGMASVLGSTDVRVTDLGSFMILPSTSSRCVRCPTSVFVMELGERPNEVNNSDGDTEQWLTVQRKGSKKSRCKLKDLGQVTETAILEDWT